MPSGARDAGYGADPVNFVPLGRMLARGMRGATYGALRFDLDRPVRAQREIDATVFTLVGTRQVLDLVVSARSFLENVGRPRRFVVISDGTLSRYDVPRIERLDESVEVRTLSSLLTPDLPREVLLYGLAQPMGQKLALEICLPVEGPTIYTDSDILYFPAASEIASLAEAGGPPWFLVDRAHAFDDRLLIPEDPRDPPVNAGFFILSSRLDWSEPLRRFENLDGEPDFHSEQTLMHLAVHQSGGRPLAKDRYILQADDASDLTEPLVGPDVVLRHYTAPVRHKLWMRVARTALRDRSNPVR